MSFDEVYGTETTEEHEAIFTPEGNSKSWPSNTVFPQCANNKNCQMCVNLYWMWKISCCICCKQVVRTRNGNLRERIKQLYQYTCGSSLQELKTDDNRTPRINALLNKCYVRGNITCEMALEVPYFSSGCFKDLCFHCGGEDDLQKVPGAYPICPGCSSTKTLWKESMSIWKTLFKAKRRKID